jgi:hypothetical protein
MMAHSFSPKGMDAGMKLYGMMRIHVATSHTLVSADPCSAEHICHTSLTFNICTKNMFLLYSASEYNR